MSSAGGRGLSKQSLRRKCGGSRRVGKGEQKSGEKGLIVPNDKLKHLVGFII